MLAPNHLSGWDIFAISYLLAPRPVRNMGKNQLFSARCSGRSSAASAPFRRRKAKVWSEASQQGRRSRGKGRRS